ncbi:MAG: hypothetical protein HQ559_01915 [Lentisphaerae bacterium]|nr:hypothetical protein [Lentisphaerota bacterium]
MNKHKYLIIVLVSVLASCVSHIEVLPANPSKEVLPANSSKQENRPPKAPGRKYEYSFLFVNRGELGAADRYVSVGTLVDGTIRVNQLLKIDRLGYYRVLARPNKCDLWIHAPSGDNLLCINQVYPLVSQIVGNAERILAVTGTGLFFASCRPRNTRELGRPRLYFLDFKTHEISVVPTHRKLGTFEWRTAVMSPDGKYLATVKANPRWMSPTGSPPGFGVLVEAIAGRNVVSLGSFPFVPRSPYSSSFHDDNLLWVGTNRLVVASGSEEDKSTYVLTLLDTQSGKQIQSQSISSRKLALSLHLAKNTHKGLPYVCRGPGEGYAFDKDLTRIEKLQKPKGQSWRIHWLRSGRGWPEPEQEMLLVSNDGKQYELKPDVRTSRSKDVAEIYRVAYAMSSTDGKLTYLVLMGLDYDSHGGAILDVKEGTLIKGASYYPICWLDGPLLDFERGGGGP